MDTPTPDYIAKELWPLCVPVSEPKLLKGNPRIGDIEAVARSLERFKQVKPIVCRRDTNEVVAGNHTLQGAQLLGWEWIAVVWMEGTDAEYQAFALADNRTSDLGTYDDEALANMIADVLEADEDLLAAASFDMGDLEELLGVTLGELDEGTSEAPQSTQETYEKPAEAPTVQKQTVSLFDRFMVPPFTVLNAREGWWKDRKRFWIGLGIEGELGREDKPRTWYIAPPEQHHNPNRPLVKEGTEPEGEPLYGDGSTSIFDPVVCELVYRWFMPPGGQVIDPFAGGSVRGIVASRLGRRYWGTDIRANQIEANETQATEILTDTKGFVPDVPADNMPEITPVEYLDEPGVWLKREDLYAFAGVRGAKVRTCMLLCEQARKSGVGVVTAGSRQSPQVNFVAQIANRMGVKCNVHVPSGPLTPELIAARGAGAKLIQHDYGYNSVIIAGAREDAEKLGWIEIPYGMESQEAVDFTKPQTANIPEGVKRIVNACGSGMTLSGILWGLKERNLSIPVVAVCVGNVPEARLDRWAPEDWREMVEIVDHPADYHTPAPTVDFHGITLDAWYEAKCIPLVQEGDLLWVSAIRPSAVACESPRPEWVVGDACDIRSLWQNRPLADGCLTCPPYGDLEVYSDDPADLSTMDYPDFIAAFKASMAATYDCLDYDTFTVVVVGDFRDKEGFYRNFPSHTIELMEAIGWRYYNEAILITPANTLPIRAGRQFDASRKLGKTHQQVLVFVKGDPKAATKKLGPVVAMDIEEYLEIRE